MKPLELNEVHVNTREAFQRACKSAARLGAKDAVELLLPIVLRNPALLPAREKLREYERVKTQEAGMLGKLKALLLAPLKMLSIKGKVESDPVAAVKACETVLATYLDNPPLLKLLADAADHANAFFLVREAMETLRTYHPTDEASLRLYVQYLADNNCQCEAAALFKEIAASHPNDTAVQGELRQYLAAASVEQNQRTEEGSISAALEKESVEQHLVESTLHDSSQAQRAIAKYEEDLKQGESMDIRRKIAEAYMVSEDYDKAIENYQLILQSLGTLDPQIDKQIERANLCKYDAVIKELEKNPTAYEAPEEQKKALLEQRADYRFRKAAERVQVYPNDQQLRYDYGMIAFERNEFQTAIEQFQMAQRNPQRRISCIYYLGRCFMAIGQADMAVNQLENALREVNQNTQSYTREKLDVLYALGQAYESAAQPEKALNCFKEIYQNDISYSDVAEKIKKLQGK
ncbi:MAG: hypothetical protein PHS41_07600 [Victivallaceae bacterium]|nr:hypothetical protein [Victivallaceae bacterium]